jgi:phosphate:Na+ symporter
MKDLLDDNKDFSNSVDQLKYNQYKNFQAQLERFYKSVINILDKRTEVDCFDELKTLLEKIKADYNSLTNSLYKTSGGEIFNEADISTILNVNREIYSSCKAMIFSLKDYLLSPEEIEGFKNIPTKV